jgi:FkbM family methyltransferase
METMPLVIREALSWKTPSLIYNLPVYMGYFDKYDTIEYLTEELQSNAYRIAEKVLRDPATHHPEPPETSVFNCSLDIKEQKIHYSTNTQIDAPVVISVKDIDSDAVIWAVTHETLPAGVNFWVMPTPKSVIDFESNTTFGGISVEFYVNGVLVKTQTFRIRAPSVHKPKLKLINTLHPNYNNYIEFFVDKIYDKYLKGNTYNTVVDLGANIGVWTEYICHIANVEKVYMVEPNHMALKLLRECFTDEHTVIVDKAVSDTNGHLDFFINTDNSLISSLANYSDLNTSYKVETITFRKLMGDYGISHINLIKIDIETGEYALLDSLTSDDFAKIDNILMEFHTIAGRTYEKDVHSLLDKLKSNGYTVDVVPLHAVGGFIFATKQHTDKNKTLTEILDTTPCPDKRDLASLVNQLYPNGIGVEIGVLRGEYSKLILERWNNGTLYLIDTWRHLSKYIDMNGQDDQYHYDCMVKTAENIKPWQHRAHMIRMDSSLSADMFPDEYFDFIYIDADHSYEGVVKDIEAWWPKIKKGGLFCGDDYIPDNGDIWLIVDDKQTYAGKFGVRHAVTEFATKINVKIYSTINEPYWKQWYTFKPY